MMPRLWPILRILVFYESRKQIVYDLNVGCLHLIGVCEIEVFRLRNVNIVGFFLLFI
jgi:hypothetical protein